MSLIELPHTRGCVACGHDNPHGLRLALHVETEDGTVTVRFVPRAQDIGFEGITHGGVLATVVDEAMVWAATWAARGFCVCGELGVRYRQSAVVGEPLTVEARVVSDRPRLIQTEATLRDAAGLVVSAAAGKYVRVPRERNRAFVATLIPEPLTMRAYQVLRDAAAQPARRDL